MRVTSDVHPAYCTARFVLPRELSKRAGRCYALRGGMFCRGQGVWETLISVLVCVVSVPAIQWSPRLRYWSELSGVTTAGCG